MVAQWVRTSGARTALHIFTILSVKSHMQPRGPLAMTGRGLWILTLLPPVSGALFSTPINIERLGGNESQFSQVNI
jgi:hypothetical protein